MRLARRDAETFALLRPLPQASISALGFHAQQAIEKALKAICTLSQLETRRTHDLAALAQTILETGDSLPLTIDEFRYDDEMKSTLAREELESLLAIVMSWADKKLACHPMPPVA